MREPRKHTNNRRSKHWRRAMLAATIIAATPVVAEENTKSTIRLVQGTSAPAMHQNPYIEAPVETATPPVELASSSNRASTVRLKPIGKVVDLNTIGTPQNIKQSTDQHPRAGRRDPGQSPD